MNLQSPITGEVLLRTREGQLRYPASLELWRKTVDEGVGSGFDGLDPYPLVMFWFLTQASVFEVVRWYERELMVGGWGPGLEAVKAQVWSFRRGQDEQFHIIHRSNEPGMWHPSGAFDRPGNVYEITYKVQRLTPPQNGVR